MSFKLAWRDEADGVKYNTLASITLLIDGTPAWPIPGEDTSEFEWFADELFAHLAECWKPLVLRQTYPIPVQPERPSLLRSEAEKRWSALTGPAAEKEEQEVAAFEDVHNLANAFGGVTGLLPLWFLRNHDDMIVDTQERLWKVPFDVARSALTIAGSAIADRLGKADHDKWAQLLTAWQQRA